MADNGERDDLLAPSAYAMFPMRWENAGLTHTAYRLLTRVCYYDRRSLESKSKKPGCIRSVSSLAKDMGLHRQAVSRALRELIHRGAVVAVPGQYNGVRALRVVWEGETPELHPRNSSVSPPETPVLRVVKL